MTVSVFIVTKSVDLSAKKADDYIQDSIAVIETMYSLNWGQIGYIMTINDVEFNDALFDPFTVTTDSIKFLTFKESRLAQFSNNDL